MGTYRTEHRAVVHPVKSAKSFTPYCNLSYRNTKELTDILSRYMRQFCGNQTIAIDISTRAILVNGSHEYTYELIAPAPTKPAAKGMY